MTWLERFASWRKHHVLVMDLLTGSIMLLFIIIVHLVGSDSSDTPGFLFQFSRAPLFAWAVALTIPVLVRRTFPQTAATSFVALVILHLLVGPSFVVSDAFGLMLLYCVIVFGDPSRTRIFIVLAYAVTALACFVLISAVGFGPITTRSDSSSITLRVCAADQVPAHTVLTWSCMSTMSGVLLYSVLVTFAILTAIMVIAFWQRARRFTWQLMEERNAALRAGEQEQRNIARLAERARIARDMHDVVAHTLSIIIVQSDGGRYAGVHDPAVARRTMRTITQESQHALRDMHQLLDVFGGDVNAHYDNLGLLVEQASHAAHDVTVERFIIGSPAPQRLNRNMNTAIYRVVQESLTNIRKYAGPHVHVKICETWTAHEVSVQISDNGRGVAATLDQHQPGIGLIGMRERVESVGGRMKAGPQVTGGFSVQATVPLISAATAADAPSHLPQRFSTADNRSALKQTSQAQPAAVVDATATSAAMQTGTDNKHSDKPHADTAFPLREVRQDLSRLIQPRRLWSRLAPTTRHLNFIERISQWTQDHYVLTDIIMVLALMVWTWVSPAMTSSLMDLSAPKNTLLSNVAVTILLLPLCLRRRAPELSALLFSACCTTLLLTADFVPTACMLAIVSVYSAVLYGGDKAWHWIGVVVIVDAVLFGLWNAAISSGFNSLVVFMAQGLGLSKGSWSAASSLGSMLLIVALCFGAIAMAQWTRSSGSNALVLQTRQEALRAEQSKQRILAANRERERIGSAIRSEVTETLDSVIEASSQGLATMQTYERDGVDPPPEVIERAFITIGTQGRSALTHMRELLGVLHQTVQSNATSKDGESQMQLTPVPSLDELLGSVRENAGR